MGGSSDEILQYLRERNITLVAVSKTQSIEAIQTMYDAGIRDFGENKVQELKEKYPQLPKDIRWHLIGHLQTNKVKYIAPWISLIHSVDSAGLLMEINRQAFLNKRVIPCLLQIHIGMEETKFGLDEHTAEAILSSPAYQDAKNISIRGLMGMATNTTDEKIIRNEFHALHAMFERIRKKHFAEQDHFTILSMGMSSDYKIAAEEGSSMVRIGSLLFGERSVAHK